MTKIQKIDRVIGIDWWLRKTDKRVQAMQKEIDKLKRDLDFHKKHSKRCRAELFQATQGDPVINTFIACWHAFVLLALMAICVYLATNH